jgi:hypothetical protein
MHIVPMILSKYEVTKILGHANMRVTPRFGMPVPKGMIVDECMGSFGEITSMKWCNGSFG